MKGRVIALDVPNGKGAAAALMVDGRLEDLVVDPPAEVDLPMAGDVLTATITRKLPNGKGAFAELAHGQSGFLRDAKGTAQGETRLVQVTSLPEPGKAIAVSPRVLFKGLHLILTPGAPGTNVSRQIKDPDERARLEAGAAAAMALEGLEDTGVILRTSAVEAEGDALQSELRALAAMLADGREALADGRSWSSHGGSALAYWRREWLVPLADQIVCKKDVAQALLAETAGDEAFAARLVVEPAPFEAAGVLDEIAGLDVSEVSLASGSMVIEPTRALVAVDVNTGQDFSPAAGLKTNIAAIHELPRQLRLRGLGGQVVVDFAPMPKKERRSFEASIRAAFRRDPIETSLVGWTEMGLYELQRKRERWPLTSIW